MKNQQYSLRLSTSRIDLSHECKSGDPEIRAQLANFPFTTYTHPAQSLEEATVKHLRAITAQGGKRRGMAIVHRIHAGYSAKMAKLLAGPKGFLPIKTKVEKLFAKICANNRDAIDDLRERGVEDLMEGFELTEAEATQLFQMIATEAAK